MSYHRTPTPAPAAAREEDSDGQHAEHFLSANAQAWRRLATVGYHRTAELVRATRTTGPAPDDTHPDTDPRSGDTHHSGFQGL